MKRNWFNFKLDSSAKQVATFAGVLSIGATAYFIYQNLFSSKANQSSKLVVVEQKTFGQIYQQVILEIQTALNKNGKINGEVIKSILSNQQKLAESEYKALILKIRQQRRKLIKDKIQYAKIIATVQKEVEQLMDKHLNAIFAHFKIQKTQWIQIIQQWSTENQQNQQEWQDLLADLDEKRLDSLRIKTNKPLNFSQLQQIYKYKIKMLQHINESGIDLDTSSLSNDEQPDLNVKYQLINTYINDLIFNKFNVEEQDIRYSEKQLNPKQQNQIISIQEQFKELIRRQIFGDESQEDQEQNEKTQQQEEDLHQEQQDEGQYF